MPIKTPRPIVGKLHGEAVKALALDNVKARLTAIGTLPVGNSPESFQALVRADLQKWAKVAKEADIKPE